VEPSPAHLQVGEFLVFAAFCLPRANGIRLVLVELGFAGGQAHEPVYPYKTSLGVSGPCS